MDHAEDAIDRDLSMGCNMDAYVARRRPARIEQSNFEFSSMIRETSKAWLLVMSGGATRWFPKSHCSISDNTVYLPTWLESMMFDEATRKLQSNKY
jgi:hypothetical protein